MRPAFSTIRALPKADLHSHIDGSIPPRDLFEIAKRHRRKLLTPGGVDLETLASFSRYVEGDGYDSLLENVVDRFYPITGLMQTEATLREAGVAYVRGQNLDGVVYAEGRFAPQYHIREGLSLKEVITAMSEGLAEGAERYGVDVRLIAAIGRESDSRTGRDVAKAATTSKPVVALDLGGPEAGNPPRKFVEAFRIARASGLKSTVHAGEGAGSPRKNIANMREAVSLLGADRLGHAIDLVRAPGVLKLVRERGTGIEMNPISNLTLKKVSSISELGIDSLLSQGVAVSVNSDDPALWPDGSLSNALHSVVEAFGFGWEELDRLVGNSFESSFASRANKGMFLERYSEARRHLR